MSGDATDDSYSHSQAAHLLLPLAARYAGWLGLPVDAAADSAEDTPESVRAMPLILRIEREAVPPRTALLEAAGSAAVALCLDERSQPGGPWYPEVAGWVAGRIRKLTRRARGAHWAAVTALPGVTVEYRGAEVRALLPWRVLATPRTVTRLQVAGTDVPPDDADSPPDGIPVLWLPPEPVMTVGKTAAQVGHATMLLASLLAAENRVAELDCWAEHGYRCAVRTASPTQWTALAAGGGRTGPGGSAGCSRYATPASPKYLLAPSPSPPNSHPDNPPMPDMET